jgi:hypothetical protein
MGFSRLLMCCAQGSAWRRRCLETTYIILVLVELGDLARLLSSMVDLRSAPGLPCNVISSCTHCLSSFNCVSSTIFPLNAKGSRSPASLDTLARGSSCASAAKAIPSCFLISSRAISFVGLAPDARSEAVLRREVEATSILVKLGTGILLRIEDDMAWPLRGPFNLVCGGVLPL